LIKRRKKICKVCNQEKFIFSKGRCEYCASKTYRKIERTGLSLRKKHTEVKVLHQTVDTSNDQIKRKNEGTEEKTNSRTKSPKRKYKASNASKVNTYKTSNGDRLTSVQVEARIKNAKKLFINNFKYEHGYHYCEDCKKNHGVNQMEGCEILDISHDISVKEAKETGRTELCWDWENNFTLRGRKCHRVHDKSY